MSAVELDQQAFVRDLFPMFADHLLARVRERACTSFEATMSDAELRAWITSAWKRASSIEVFRDPDAPALPTYVARTASQTVLWYLVARPCVVDRDGVGIVLISALRSWMYERNKQYRWRPWGARDTDSPTE